MQSTGRFYIKDSDILPVDLAEGTIRLLFNDGVIDQLRSDAGLAFEMDAYEQDELPLSCLDALAASCRRAAVRYEEAPSIRNVRWQSWSIANGKRRRTEHVLEVEAGDVRDALLRIADLAERAQGEGVSLFVSL